MNFKRVKKALTASAFFMLGVCALPAAGLAAEPPAPASVCPADHIDEQVIVKEAIDGDTLALEDGRKLRLIGIDTPEIAHDGKPSEAFAEAARQRLQALLKNADQRLGLRHDQQHYDRYDRLLAHAYLPDGRSINAILLQEGLAVLIVVPPNAWHYACNRPIAEAARKAKRGLWELPRYQGVAVTELSENTTGYYSVTGKITDSNQADGHVWIHLGEQMVLTLGKFDRLEFQTLDLPKLSGKRVRVSGWLQQEREHYRMHLKHPSQLEILD